MDAVHDLGMTSVFVDLVEDVVTVLVRLGQILDLVLGDHGQLEAKHISQALLGLLECGSIHLLGQAIGELCLGFIVDLGLNVTREPLCR